MYTVELKSGLPCLLVFAMTLSSACGGATVNVEEKANGAPASPANGENPGLGEADGGIKDAAGEGRRDADVGGTVGVPCGVASCASPAWCQICDPSKPVGPRTCETAPAGGCTDPWGPFPPLRMSCDGKEDCQPKERCLLFEESLGTYTRCFERPVFGGVVVCRSLADCPPEARACEPGAANYPVSFCKM